MVVVLLREEEYNKNPIYMKLDFVKMDCTPFCNRGCNKLSSLVTI